MNSSLCALALSLSLLSGNLAAATFTVNTTTDAGDINPGNGTCSIVAVLPPALPICSLRAAIMEANATTAADIIVLQDGATYTLTRAGRNENNATTGDLDIRQPVTIATPLVFGIPSGQATIDANGMDRVFDIISVGGAGVSLLGLKIKGGDFGGDFQKQGAGVHVSGSKAKLWFLEVSALDGAGIAINGNTFASQADISYSSISGGANGAAVGVIKALATIDSSSLLRSRLGISYGVQASEPGTKVRVVNSTVSGHSSYGLTLGFGAEVIVEESTIANNLHGIAIGNGGGIGRATNTLFASNGESCQLQEGDDSVLDMRNNHYDDATCPQGANDSSTFNTPAFLSLLGDHGGLTPTHRPMVNSLAIDRIGAGPACLDDDVDQRLMPRQVAFKGGAAKCDIGAVELETDVIFFDQVDRL